MSIQKVLEYQLEKGHLRPTEDRSFIQPFHSTLGGNFQKKTQKIQKSLKCIIGVKKGASDRHLSFVIQHLILVSQRLGIGKGPGRKGPTMSQMDENQRPKKLKLIFLF